MEEILVMLIPVIALLIGLAGATGSLIVKPLVQALEKLTEAQSQVGSRSEVDALELEQRVASLENSLARIRDEQNFHRELQGGAE
ncbi:MAG TPA: hypothetical protein VFI91_03645 [Longimicrobiaceae bacterium]|nr:hypothetical protein [Longimicrobiaceae bacterium]